MRARGLVDNEGRLTNAGAKTKEQVESVTDALAMTPYATLTPTELSGLTAALEPITKTLNAAGSR
jgi:hypothetical protein